MMQGFPPMNRQKVQRIVQEHAFTGVIVLLLLVILGIWAHQWRFERQVDAALEVEIPYSILAGGAQGAPARNVRHPVAADGATSGSRGSQLIPAPTPTPKIDGVTMEMPKSFDDLVMAKGLFGPSGNSARIQCIWGDRVLIDNQWLRLNQPHDNKVVREIGLNRVLLEVNGLRQELTIWPKPAGK